MARVLVVYHSRGGRTRSLAEALAEGARDAGAEVVLRTVPDPQDPEAASVHPLGTVEELAAADGIAFGSPVHFGATSAALHGFLEGTGDLWRRGALARKPATVFVAAGSGGGREAAVLSLWSLLATHGMILVPPGVSLLQQAGPGEVHGAGPFAAGSLQALAPQAPTAADLRLAAWQGRLLAEVSAALVRARPDGSGP